jgi:hypothetical protein
VDDHKSDPLRQALVQKTDFRFEVDPVSGESHRWKFKLEILSAIDQPVPESGKLFWSREHLVFYREPDANLVEQGAKDIGDQRETVDKKAEAISMLKTICELIEK